MTFLSSSKQDSANFQFPLRMCRLKLVAEGCSKVHWDSLVKQLAVSVRPISVKNCPMTRNISLSRSVYTLGLVDRLCPLVIGLTVP